MTAPTRSPRVALLDYEAGNLRSAQRGLERAGAAVTVTDDAELAAEADALVVPGVGHVGSCLAALRRRGLADLVVDWAAAGRPMLGICVGLQLLYEHSEEGDTTGLGVVPGRVVRLPASVRVPHMGWNVVTATDDHAGDPLLRGVDGHRAYFVHSYRADPAGDGHVVATTPYPDPFPSVVRVGVTVGTQFHPEKSAEVGAALLRNWVTSLAEASGGPGHGEAP